MDNFSSLALREQAYHHLGVDENHERWETRVAGWIDKNNELEGELARDSLELQPEEA
jgi:hypothetical protein